MLDINNLKNRILKTNQPIWTIVPTSTTQNNINASYIVDGYVLGFSEEKFALLTITSSFFDLIYKPLYIEDPSVLDHDIILADGLGITRDITIRDDNIMKSKNIFYSLIDNIRYESELNLIFKSGLNIFMFVQEPDYSEFINDIRPKSQYYNCLSEKDIISAQSIRYIKEKYIILDHFNFRQNRENGLVLASENYTLQNFMDISQACILYNKILIIITRIAKNVDIIFESKIQFLSPKELPSVVTFASQTIVAHEGFQIQVLKSKDVPCHKIVTMEDLIAIEE